MLPNNRFCFAETGTLIRTTLLIAALGLLPDTVYAVPLYSGGIGGGGTVNASPNPVFLSNLTERVDRDGFGNVIGEGNTQAVAAASYGRLQGSSTADYLNVQEFDYIGQGINSGEGSDFRLDDLVITGPPGNIMVSFNFVISGSIGATTVSTGGSQYYLSGAHAEARIVSIQSSFGGGGLDLGKIDVNSQGYRSASGIFSSFPVDFDGTVTGTTPVILTYAGDPALILWLGLATSASAGTYRGAGPGWTNGHASFNFGFPTSGPVANLPEGYTLNSADGRIVDNRFVPLLGDYNNDGSVNAADYVVWRDTLGSNSNFTADGDDNSTIDIGDYSVWQQDFGRTSGSSGLTSVGVPEPASLVLLLVGMLAFTFARWSACNNAFFPAFGSILAKSRGHKSAK